MNCAMEKNPPNSNESNDTPNVRVIKSPTDVCMQELTDWCKKWGPFSEEALFRSIKIDAGINNVCTIETEVYVPDYFFE